MKRNEIAPVETGTSR